MDRQDIFSRWRVKSVRDEMAAGFAVPGRTLVLQPDGPDGARLRVSDGFCDPARFHWKRLALKWGSGDHASTLVGVLDTHRPDRKFQVELYLARKPAYKNQLALVCDLRWEDYQPQSGSWEGEEDAR